MLFICNEFAVLIPCLVQFKDRRQNKTKQFGKSEWEVLTQATERVLVRSQLSAFLSFVFCFATTGERAWVVYTTRKLPESGAGLEPSCELHIVEVSVDRLPFLALTLNAKSVEYPGWFLTCDGGVIINTLSSIGVLPLHCRVKFLKQSMDRVYLLNLPVEAHGVPFKVLSGHNDTSLALKVVGGDRFGQEASALQKIAQENSVPGFYALGAVSPTSESVWFLETHQKHYAQRVALSSGVKELVDAKNAWWGKHYDFEGGAIIMQAALSHQPSATRGQIVHGVKNILKVAHKLNIVHTDIRQSNILHFKTGWQLIDFGLSAKAGSEVNLLKKSSRAGRCGERIRGLLEETDQGNITCQWDFKDDIEMLDGLEF